jgi:hypothetical protein
MEKSMELYNYDTQETESIEVSDLTESQGMSYIPDAWPDLKLLYRHHIDAGHTVAESLLFVFLQHISNGSNYRLV